MIVSFTMNNNLGYIALDLSSASKGALFDIVSKKIPEKDYFQSLDPGYAYINGNVCQKAHVTICYGIKNLDLKKKFKAAKLKLNWQLNARIKAIQINLGYKGKYYIIVAIPKINREIFLFDSWIRQNNEIIPDALPFNPHIALCYIKNQDNICSTELLKYFQEKLNGKIIEFEAVNFYNKQRFISLIHLK